SFPSFLRPALSCRLVNFISNARSGRQNFSASFSAELDQIRCRPTNLSQQSHELLRSGFAVMKVLSSFGRRAHLFTTSESLNRGSLALGVRRFLTSDLRSRLRS